MSEQAGFFARFNGLVKHWAARLSKRELRVLLAYLACADNTTGQTYAKMETVGKDIGLGRRDVHFTLKRLLAVGAMKLVEQGGGRGKSTVYQVTTEVETAAPPAAVSERENCRVFRPKLPCFQTETAAPPAAPSTLPSSIPSSFPPTPHPGGRVLRSDCAAARSEDRPVKTPKAKTPPDPNHNALIKHFTDGWEDRRGGKYPFDGRDAKRIQNILRRLGGDFDMAVEAVDRYLDAPDPWLDRQGRSIEWLERRLAAYTNDGDVEPGGFKRRRLTAEEAAQMWKDLKNGNEGTDTQGPAAA